MTFLFKKPRGISLDPPPRKSNGRLQANWSRDPKTGRLVQTWRESDDGERSCTGRREAPPSRGWARELKRAA